MQTRRLLEPPSPAQLRVGFAIAHLSVRHSMMAARFSIEELGTGARFFRRLPHFLTHPITASAARAAIEKRRRNRTADFLALVRKGIYGNRRSPYRKLLDLAGCEFPDLEEWVRREGIEESLRMLFRHGVYFTIDELNGDRIVTRGSARFSVVPSECRNPLALSHLLLHTAGSRSTGRVVPLDLAFLAECARNRFLNLEARRGLRWRHALWGVPGGGAVGRLFDFALFGSPFERWFSPVAPDDKRLHPRYRWSVHLLRWGSRLAGVTVPRAEPVSLDDVSPILEWIEAKLAADETPHIWAYASAAVRISHAARKAGVDIHGLQFTATGEPLTAARLKAIRDAGADAVPTYATVQSGPIGYGCLASEAAEDFHFFDDLHALIQPGATGTAPALPENAFLLSSLRREEPLIFLNVALGDQGVLATRACGCPLEHLGWGTHLRSIRSYEKLTAGGMTFLDTDVVRVLEEELPSRFGGAPTDYQLVETERDDGLPELKLLIHPSVGALDLASVLETFIEAISDGTQPGRVMGLAWRDARLIRVERRPPLTTAAGKIMHLHFEPTQKDSV